MTCYYDPQSFLTFEMKSQEHLMVQEEASICSKSSIYSHSDLKEYKSHK